MRGLISALAFIVVLVGGAAGFWFFRLQTQQMAVAVRNQTAVEVAMFVNGVPARLYPGEADCKGGSDADLSVGLPPGGEGWFCHTVRSGITGARICYEARAADGTVLAAVQWNANDWTANGSVLNIQRDDPRRECHVTVSGT